MIALEPPFLYDIVGVGDDRFVWLDQEYPVSFLNIYSDSAWGHLSEWAQYAKKDELLSAASENMVNLYLSGRGHFSLTDLSLASRLLVRLLDGSKPSRDRVEYLCEVNQICLEFLNHYLKDLDQMR
ncbi:MAG: hypothetical protein KatS3mg047_0048 [Bellilinea sp.]|nr:MAG: hypothetical protein KatS3mg047_0048 [Bellilinea sp.]